MKTSNNILTALLLLGLPAILHAEQSSVDFARSGQKVQFSIVDEKNRENRYVLLAPNGQPCGEPITAQRGAIEFTAPAVRVPLVFRIASANDLTQITPREWVVYPDRWLPWEKDQRLAKYKETQFAAVGAPDWFINWLDAVGFSLEMFPSSELLRGRTWRKREKSALLILGRKAAGRDEAEIQRLAVEHQANVLVLEADWFGKSESVETGIQIVPQHARGALAELQTQQWPLPPIFRRRAIPWPIVSNRLTWLDSAKYPLVEEIFSRQMDADSPRIVFSYLPWQEQLGRCETADELLLRILAEAAKEAKDRHSFDGQWRLLFPDIDKIKADERPVLAAALKSAEPSDETRPALTAEPTLRRTCGCVLDLRGEIPRPAEIFAESGIVKTIESRIDENIPLLILGDHSKLDAWEWLKLDREHRRSLRPGVCWQPDNSLPPSLESQLRMMEILTQWNIILVDAYQEKK